MPKIKRPHRGHQTSREEMSESQFRGGVEVGYETALADFGDMLADAQRHLARLESWAVSDPRVEAAIPGLRTEEPVTEQTKRATEKFIRNRLTPRPTSEGPNVRRPRLALEILQRRTIPEWLDGAVRAIELQAQGSMPVVVIHVTKTVRSHDLVITRLLNFESLLKEVEAGTA